MRFEVVWADEALAAAQAFLLDDPAGLLAVFEVVDRLADDPRPAAAVAWGAAGFLRLRIGRYRVLYEVDDRIVRVDVVHLGRGSGQWGSG